MAHYTPDNLIGGAVQPILSTAATLALGQDCDRGAVLGRELRDLGAATADPGNTGEGSMTSASRASKTKLGNYVITCHTVAGGGVGALFEVVDPDGIRLADAEADVYYASQSVHFEISTYGAAFAVGDNFTIEFKAGSGNCVLLDKIATDGSAEIYGILAEDVDATAGAKTCAVYLSGEFNAAALSLAHGTTVADIEDDARKLGILFRTNIPA
jgi:hypothetical protein